MIIIKIPHTLSSNKFLSKPLSTFTALLTLLLFACNPVADHQKVETPSANTQDTKANHKTADSSTASPVFPGGDAIQVNCEFIQDQAEALLEEYYRPGTPSKRLKEIISELENLNQQWVRSDCQQVFGFMVPEIPRRSQSIK